MRPTSSCHECTDSMIRRILGPLLLLGLLGTIRVGRGDSWRFLLRRNFGIFEVRLVLLLLLLFLYFSSRGLKLGFSFQASGISDLNEVCLDLIKVRWLLKKDHHLGEWTIVGLDELGLDLVDGSVATFGKDVGDLSKMMDGPVTHSMKFDDFIVLLLEKLLHKENPERDFLVRAHLHNVDLIVNLMLLPMWLPLWADSWVVDFSLGRCLVSTPLVSIDLVGVHSHQIWVIEFSDF